jgi:putative addiction module antidote
MRLKLRAIGASTGVLLPKAMLTRLKVRKGNTLFAVETSAGYLLTPHHGDVEKQFGLGRAFMAKYGSVFRALAR